MGRTGRDAQPVSSDVGTSRPVATALSSLSVGEDFDATTSTRSIIAEDILAAAAAQDDALQPSTLVEFCARSDRIDWPAEMAGSRLAARVSVWAAGDWECTVTSGLRVQFHDSEAFLKSGGWDKKCGRGWAGAKLDRQRPAFVNHTLRFAPAMTVDEILSLLGVDLRVDGNAPELQTRRQRRRLRALLRSGDTSFHSCRLERYDGNSCLATALTGQRFFVFEFYTS